MPCGLADGLPVGLQIMAPALADERLYRVAGALEAELDARRGGPLAEPLPARRTGGVPDDHHRDSAPLDYEPVIGLETHVELGTVSKMFCGCPTAFGAEPNTQVCPVCLGLPGALPVVNEAAIALTVRIGLALNCEIAPWCRFARKNYFYPDMPKNFQISQYDEPLCVGGYLDVEVDGEKHRVGITRVHMEEDTGKSLHVGGSDGRIHGATHSLLDYNRAGVPLVEIVTEPDIRSAEVAAAYVTELRELLRALGVSEVRMEQGQLRCDANVSLRLRGTEKFGTRTETKNLNSIRSVERAITHEIGRQAAACSTPAAGSCRRPVTSTRRAASPRPGAPRKRRPTTATSRSPTCCRSRWTRRSSTRFATRCPSSRRPAVRGCASSSASARSSSSR